jgi:hypothetical protein
MKNGLRKMRITLSGKQNVRNGREESWKNRKSWENSRNPEKVLAFPAVVW